MGTAACRVISFIEKISTREKISSLNPDPLPLCAACCALGYSSARPLSTPSPVQQRADVRDDMGEGVTRVRPAWHWRLVGRHAGSHAHGP